MKWPAIGGWPFWRVKPPRASGGRRNRLARRPWWPLFVVVAALLGAGVEAWHLVRQFVAPPPVAAPAEPPPADPRWFTPVPESRLADAGADGK